MKPALSADRHLPMFLAALFNNEVGERTVLFESLWRLKLHLMALGVSDKHHYAPRSLRPREYGEPTDLLL
ncbi:hypothetical protein A6U87_22750 [Rhizobium sp. AC44/96]|nr:hypothetical protein A6U87_22750 [Rhizobium sp. AC44/96]